MKNTTMKKILASAGVAGLLLGGFAIGAISHPIQHTRIVPVKEPVIKYVNVTTEKIVEKPVEVIKNVTVEVPFEDISFKKMACDRLMYDDMQDCVKEVKAEDSAIKKASNYIETNFDEIANDLEDEGIVSDDRDVTLVKSYTDYEDIDIQDSDYDNNEYKFKFKIKINDDHTYKYQYATLSVNDGDVEVEDVE